MTEATGRVARGPRGVPLAGNVFRAWSDPLGLIREAAKVELEPGVTLRPRGGLRLYLRPRDRKRRSVNAPGVSACSTSTV